MPGYLEARGVPLIARSATAHAIKECVGAEKRGGVVNNNGRRPYCGSFALRYGGVIIRSINE